MSNYLAEITTLDNNNQANFKPNYLAEITTLDNNNQANFKPVNLLQHNTKNDYGTVIHTACLTARPRENTPAISIEADCLASEMALITTNNFDGMGELEQGDYALQNPINPQIQVIVSENKTTVKAGNSQIQILQDGNIQITSAGNISSVAGTSNINIAQNGNISLTVAGTAVANFTPTAINFLVPINAPAGSTVKGQLIAIQGGVTTGNATTQKITTAQP